MKMTIVQGKLALKIFVVSIVLMGRAVSWTLTALRDLA